MLVLQIKQPILQIWNMRRLLSVPLNKNRESVLDLREFRSGLQEQKFSVLLTLSSAHWLKFGHFVMVIFKTALIY